MAEKVIVLSGEEPIKRYFNVEDRSGETVAMLLRHIEVYEFPSSEEAEAFRFGLCAVTTPTARDVCELTLKGYETLVSLEKHGETTNVNRGKKYDL